MIQVHVRQTPESPRVLLEHSYKWPSTLAMANVVNTHVVGLAVQVRQKLP